jgi:hypothetical protein
MVTHAHMLGIRSSGGPVIRCPQQQKVLRAGHTMYERSMVFGCGGAALLVALSARARSTNPADGGGVQGGAFGLLGVFGVLGVAGAVFAMPRLQEYSCPFGKRRHRGAEEFCLRSLSPVPAAIIAARLERARAPSLAARATMNVLRPLITPRGAVRALSLVRQPNPFLATRQLASKATTGRRRGGMTRLPPPLPPPPPRPSTSAADDDEESWTNSQARTESLWQNEKWAVITFVATAPIFYGMFWYVGILDRYNPMDELSKEESRGDQLKEEIRAEARANVEAQWGAAEKPVPDQWGHVHHGKK